MEEILKQILGEVKGLKQDVGELKGLRQDVQGLQQDMRGLKQDVGELKTSMVKIESRIENEVIEKIRALFDAREVQQDVNQRVISTLDRIEAKIDVLQLETAHIRRLK